MPDSEEPSPPFQLTQNFHINQVSSPEATSTSSSDAQQTTVVGFQLGKAETRFVAWSLLVLSAVNVVFGGLRLFGCCG